MTTHYHAGWNMVGYLPEMDASYPFESFEAAKASMIDDLLWFADDEALPTEGEELSSEAEDLNLDNGPEWGTIVGNMSYWIVACVEAECLEEEEYAR